MLNGSGWRTTNSPRSRAPTSKTKISGFMNPASRTPPGRSTRNASRQTGARSGQNTFDTGWNTRSKVTRREGAENPACHPARSAGPVPPARPPPDHGPAAAASCRTRSPAPRPRRAPGPAGRPPRPGRGPGHRPARPGTSARHGLVADEHHGPVAFPGPRDHLGPDRPGPLVARFHLAVPGGTVVRDGIKIISHPSSVGPSAGRPPAVGPPRRLARTQLVRPRLADPDTAC